MSRLLASASKQPFGPCWVSAGWNDASHPELVSAVVTHELPNGLLLPGVALVDRTCLGVKDGFASEPLTPHEASQFAAKVGTPHGGMEACEPLLVQSIVYHAIAYARSLGFSPHRDFPEALFGPVPKQLLDTPFCAPERPMFFPGPRDNVSAIMSRLNGTVGDGNYIVASDPALLSEQL
ncbi:MAG: hypothetical protein OXR73_39070 [Myxococcales bacterium]|nr:hypothetical protein [Myxococcales bacterium]